MVSCSSSAVRSPRDIRSSLKARPKGFQISSIFPSRVSVWTQKACLAGRDPCSATTRESLPFPPSPNPAANTSSSVIDHQHQRVLGVGLEHSTAFVFLGLDCCIDFRDFCPPLTRTGHERYRTSSSIRDRPAGQSRHWNNLPPFSLANTHHTHAILRNTSMTLYYCCCALSCSYLVLGTWCSCVYSSMKHHHISPIFVYLEL